jgi:hypothetical protein
MQRPGDYPGDKFAHMTYNFPWGVGHFFVFCYKFCPILWGICLFWYGIQCQSPPISFENFLSYPLGNFKVKTPSPPIGFPDPSIGGGGGAILNGMAH